MQPGFAKSRFDVPAALPETPHCTELIIRRSRFLAQSAHTPGTQAARAFIEQIRRQYPDASHNCWAYAAGSPGETAQIGASDDGEPHGTAGRPMLQIVLHSPIGEICVVVSRWFGGIKLGTGGLVRAYQESVRNNLATLPLRLCPCDMKLHVVIAYTYLNGLHRLLSAHEAHIEAENYQSEVSVLLRLPSEHMSIFIESVTSLSNGTAKCTPMPKAP
ncbi:MAG: YigZ family protein [Desulfovibrio sp.]|nr:YigZ family protein [Desulfovibrio sp.]